MTRRRHNFTKPVKREAWERAQGICECHRLVNVPGLVAGGCNQPLGPGNTFYEHIRIDWIRPDNSLENCAVLTKTCWRLKTAAYDLPTIAKTKRLIDAHRGIRGSASPVPGSRDTPFIKRMTGRTDKRPGHWS
jgi:hypothetical protein